jgi:thiol-disulfide isomerase/thioredoxin
VVNDTLGGAPIAVALCEQCTGGAAFVRKVDGRTLSMRVAGVYNGTIVLRDRETGTLFSPFGGRGLEGPLVDRTLARVPLLITHWDDWVARHPATDVVLAAASERGGHGAWYTPGKWGIVSEMGETIADYDPRLPENTLVFGVQGGNGKAFPLSTVRARGGVVNDDVESTPVVIAAGRTLEAAGFARRLDGRVLSFRPSKMPGLVMEDEETGSGWSLEGVAEAGPLRGQRLAPVDGYAVEWHVWSAYNPRTDLLVTTAAPRSTPPADPPLFPAFFLPTPEGGPPRAVRLEGELNLVVLFAAWCPPCRVEMPRVKRLVESHAADGLRAVGIAIHIPEDLERQAVRRFLAEQGVTFPTFLVDDAAYDRIDALVQSLGGPGLVLPTVLAVDRQGRVRGFHHGSEVESLEATVDRLLAARPAPTP